MRTPRLSQTPSRTTIAYEYKRKKSDFSLKDLKCQMFNDQDLGFFANSLGIIILFLVIGYHFVMADIKYEGN
ncbi:hypothetical protein L1987_29421 [Smallanthus sonchifolius]|uniref:Uncharacterized protein n=1 Tax=Smallanthus sonchifolius TaxID=185202 RepID=A0ACB9I0J3_9ASTR|nr:hypothetical protein L1987_29421 [Smallanthus sonchifolius]